LNTSLLMYEKSYLTKAILISGFFFVCMMGAQNTDLNIDELETNYLNKEYSNREELKVLEELVNQSKNPQKILIYSNQLIEKAAAADSIQYLFKGYLQRGNAYRLKSDLTKALDSYFKAAKIANEGIKNEGDSISMINLALTNITIGDVYSVMGNHDNSIAYYEEAILSLRKNSKDRTDSINLATALLNIGDEYFYVDDYDKAMEFLAESGKICKILSYRVGSAYNLGNIGMVYAKQNKPQLAQENINKAIQILIEEKDYYPISVYLIYIAEIYMDLDKPAIAIEYAQRGLDMAIKYQLKDEISDANLKLSEIYDKIGNHESALFHYKKYIEFRDLVNNVSKVQELGDLRTEFEVSKKQIENDLLTQQNKNQRILTYSFLGGILLLSLLVFGLYRRNRFINKTKSIIDEEKKKIDELLCNILPEETAEELKKYGKVKAKKHNSVTVLFTDFKEFTSYAEGLPPEKLVEMIDVYFTAFDKIIVKYNLEKIKTIGDSYMCAGGLPEPSEDHHYRITKAAFEIIEFVNNMKQQAQNNNESRLDVRIGIHTGPVVAGVVGKNKFCYDIWGNTVNTASRMESSGEIGKVNISEATHALLKENPEFSFKSRGKIETKGKRLVEMYFVELN